MADFSELSVGLLECQKDMNFRLLGFGLTGQKLVGYLLLIQGSFYRHGGVLVFLIQKQGNFSPASQCEHH